MFHKFENFMDSKIMIVSQIIQHIGHGPVNWSFWAYLNQTSFWALSDTSLETIA